MKAMTPKEKANELVTEYKYCCGGSDIIQLRTNAKQCALIAVDELIKIIDSYKDEQYWIQVKTEIEKL